MCTPIQIDASGIDLSRDIPRLTGASAPAGNGAPNAAQIAETQAVVNADGSPIAPTPFLMTKDPDLVPGVKNPNVPNVLPPAPLDVSLETSGTNFRPTPPDPALGGHTTSGPDPATPTGGTKNPAIDPSLGGHTTSGPDPATPTTTPLDQNTLLINSLTDLAHHFTDSTTGILDAQTNAANALHNGFLSLSDQQQKALDAAAQLRQNTGQASRSPSYSLSVAKNRRANSNGQGSTMLTGAQGVPTNTLALGRAQLLGGATA